MAFDVIVVGAGLSGLVAAAEIIAGGKRVLLLDQEPESSFGGQAWWSFGGLFLVDSPEQRRLGIRDSRDLAWQDWLGTAGFDRVEDAWARKWAEGYVDFAAGEKRAWLKSLGIRLFPVVGWAERGGSLADGPGNSVPRFHIVWGTGPGLVAPFAAKVRQAIRTGLVVYRPRHQVDELITHGGAVTGVRGSVLVPSSAKRGEASSREAAGTFEYHAPAVVVASGGIGGNHDLIRRYWPSRLGRPPNTMLSGVPAHVDGRMLFIAEDAGGWVVNRDRMWHYTEGIRNWDPVWAQHGIRILPGPSSVWLDAAGRRLPAPNFPGFDTLRTLQTILDTGYDYSWFILTRRVIEKEFALSGSEQNPDLTGKQWLRVLSRVVGGIPGPVKAFLHHGEDFAVARGVPELVEKMNRLAGNRLLRPDGIHHQLLARDREMSNPFGKDSQVAAMRGARRYLGDRLVRAAPPHKFLDAKHGPLIAVRLRILSRKTLGGLQTDLSGRVLRASGEPLPGLYAVGEAAGFGGGGMHGYRSLEGTFLGGCLFTGRVVGQTLAKA
ncbi:FAD-binding dehydrogenase [Alicyclobacillus cycloheptanicus]|uniref:Oxidoreductase n=1 Tax=Alicyclobacillus cycloheptanicus TaxID=1457 RepID=A0ABT9XK95_9BACL|nr:FAD-binding dehydrogenase [Alicyclobacillus cycloheptanicus]MDQ0190716.1 putative oxidoreductase [Alicyclobacillus cycloheptanicus]WDL99885.1 FAD-binding dehydrogenase [Alicyclobacillus cycloheptanicus]